MMGSTVEISDSVVGIRNPVLLPHTNLNSIYEWNENNNVGTTASPQKKTKTLIKFQLQPLIQGLPQDSFRIAFFCTLLFGI